MRRLRTISSRRLRALSGALVALAISGGIAQAALTGDPAPPPPKPLDRALYDAANAPDVAGVRARVTFTNDLLPSGSLPAGSASPLAEGASGRVWIGGDGRARLELQSTAGDAQIAIDRDSFSIYDAASKTVYTGALPAGHERDGDDAGGGAVSLADVRGGLDRLARAWTLSGAQPGTTGGEPSYTVRIAPKDDGGLLGAAEIAWDAARGVPLRAAVYAQGASDPVLELEATDVAYGRVPAADLAVQAPAGTSVTEIDPVVADGPQGAPGRVHGVRAVARRLPFELAAPASLAGLPRTDVRLTRHAGELGALSVYGDGLGAVLVFQRAASGGASPLAKSLPQVNVDGATGAELATALGTMLTFERGGVAYTVAGLVPPVAAENVARGIR